MTAAHLRRLQLLVDSGRRVLLGIAGAPGSGKSTLAQQLQAAHGPLVQVVPMDGFHLARIELQRLGLADRQGAEDTFDSAGYVALLRRLRAQRSGELVYAPDFRRDCGEPIAGAIAIHPHTRVVVTEGNYLLLERGHWAQVRALLDEAWFVEVDDVLRRARLVERHVRFGRTPAQAAAWAEQVDEPNARLIEASRHRADLVVRCG